MLNIAAQEIDRLADYPALVDALAAAFRGQFEVPLRHHHTIALGTRPEATLLLMPAWTSQGAGNAYVGLKSVTIYPDNPGRGEPTVQGMYFLLDGQSGRPLALIDGPELTVRRTAAASALAARYLARDDASNMLMVGSGAMAPCLVRAHRSVRPIETVTIWNRNLDNAEALAETLRGEGIAARATTNLEPAARTGAAIRRRVRTARARREAMTGERYRVGS